MIKRTIYQEIVKTINSKPVTVITGARQVGKTTLCSLIEKELGFGYVSLADPLTANAAKNDPAEFLSTHPAPYIIDEIQKAPELFEYLHGVVDNQIRQGNDKSLYVLTGSQSYQLMKGVTESLAGRVGLISMEPLSLSEINEVAEVPFDVDFEKARKRCDNYMIETNKLYEYIVRGFFPMLYKDRDMNSSSFYSDYLSAYLERDVSDFISLKDKQKFLSFMTVLASLTGQELIYDNLAKELEINRNTVQSWISVLLAGNIIHLLQPYHENSITKRVIKRPKVYFSDTGLACYLARVNSPETLKSSYLKGHMVETYIINEIIKSYRNNRKDVEASFYYYRTFEKDEIDLIILRDGKLTLVECKAGEKYDQDDIKAFEELRKTKLKMGKNAIVCTTHIIYPIGNNCYCLPISSI